MIRLAWHSAGSYRVSDGRGGSNGGRIRFDPESNWPDNANLDKARKLLEPIKVTYGSSVSWADIIILAGYVAIESMGGPILGFCGGRVDDMDGSKSILLGPTPEQEELFPCPVNGDCKSPLGASTVGLIYVNPDGPMGEPSPNKSAPQIREVFGRMSMNDSETVALIGGGHTLGKCHGFCPGNPTYKVPNKGLPGKRSCGRPDGKGKETFTSGFELSWTSKPLQWDTEYFINLLTYDWDVEIGQGGRFQWDIKNGSKSTPTVDLKSNVSIGMLTSDIALLNDPEYLQIVKYWETDQASFDHAFKHAWYKLTTRDMGPATRCLGNEVPDVQDWQYPLPPPPTPLSSMDPVKDEIISILNENPSALGSMTRLAWRCSSTFRVTDYLGGCNGAKIRLSPQKDWGVNKGVSNALELLSTVKNNFGDGLAWADLIILAGNTAIRKAGGNDLSFCGGRSDAVEDGGASRFLEPKVTGVINNTVLALKAFISSEGLTLREFTVLNGAGYAIGDTCNEGFFCLRDPVNTTSISNSLTNIFFTNILSNDWAESTHPESGDIVLKSVEGNLYMWPTDGMFKSDPELNALTTEYSTDNNLFLSDFSLAWTRLSNIDRYKGPSGNVCNDM